MVAFLDWPHQLDLLRAAQVPLAAAAEEILRWTTPSPSRRRNATAECTLGGRTIQPEEKGVVWEGSANRDDRHFEAPDEFRLGRDPNPHLTFGHVVHFCLSAHLARLEMRVALEENAAHLGLVRARGIGGLVTQ